MFFSLAFGVSASQTNITYFQKGNINISNPEISQAFYDELKGSARDYFIDSKKDFQLNINVVVPNPENRDGKYSIKVFSINGDKENQVALVDGTLIEWEPYYEKVDRDYFLKGPELIQQFPAGKYKIEIYSNDNLGKYILFVEGKELITFLSVLNNYWQLPFLKATFFKTSVLEFFFTPFGIAGIVLFGGLLIFLALIYYLIGVAKKIIKHNQAKTLLLTSSFPEMQDEIIKLLQKPAYDVTVAFIMTAHKYKLEDDPSYRDEDLQLMRNTGFNVEEVDIDGKTEVQVMKLLEFKDIIFVAGGNTFYLLKSMRKCNFETVIRKLLKWGKVYIGVSAGSIVAGKTIQTANWKNIDKNAVGLKDLKGLGLVPFDLFVHYEPEWAEIIKQKIPKAKKRLKNLRILEDGQAILVQGKEVDLIGDGEAIVI